MKYRIIEYTYKGNLKSYKVQRKVFLFWHNCKINGFANEYDADFPTIEEAESYIEKLIKSERIIDKKRIVKIIEVDENV